MAAVPVSPQEKAIRERPGNFLEHNGVGEERADRTQEQMQFFPLTMLSGLFLLASTKVSVRDQSSHENETCASRKCTTRIS